MDTLKKAEALVRTIKKELEKGSIHFDGKGRHLKTPRDVLSCLLRENKVKILRKVPRRIPVYTSRGGIA